MSKIDDLLNALAEEGGLTDEERDSLADEMRRRKTQLTRKPAEETSVARNHERGVDMYGEETPEEAQERWRRQEMEDLNGVLGPGGATAGGIFGSGAIPTSDYDPEAQARASVRSTHAANARLVAVLDKMMSRLEAAEARASLPGMIRERAFVGMSGVSRRLLRGDKK